MLFAHINRRCLRSQLNNRKNKHMKQEVIKSFGPLTNMGTNIIGGLTQFEEVLGIVHVPKIKMETDLLALITSNTVFQNGRLLLNDRREELRNATRLGRELIMITRDMFKPRFGAEFSINWIVLGFKMDLKTPDAPEDVKVFLRAIHAYLTANPAFEMAALGITAANAQAKLDALNAAEIAFNLQDSAQGGLRDNRDASLETLYGTVRALIGELNLKLGSLDPRWKAFGLNIPGADETPEAPLNVKATLIGPTAAAVKWDASPRAQYYRVWMKVHGSAGDYVAVGSPADLDFTIENLPMNSMVDIVVSAVNTGGESSVSEVITITTH